mmetsp:Transcript_43748/g.86272  ORF Transcript_43748/g.86272 Transcript_43748/m.86272 type:complete len:123 (-) Transcript_43748:180-548(-)
MKSKWMLAFPLSTAVGFTRCLSKSAVLFSRSQTLRSASSMAAQQKCQVAIVGCGLPGRGMGWYHSLNILEGGVPSAELTDVVEPWFLGAGKDTPGGHVFFSIRGATPVGSLPLVRGGHAPRG